MKKLAIFIFVGLGLLVLAVLGCRIAATRWLTSVDVRDYLQRQVEKNLRIVSPDAQVEISPIELSGLMTVTIPSISLRKNEQSEKPLKLMDTTLIPQVVTSFRKREIVLEFSTHMSTGGVVYATMTMPLRFFNPSSSNPHRWSEISTSGSISFFTAAPWAELFSEENGPFVRLTAGVINAEFTLWHSAHARDSGRFFGKLENAEWNLGSDPNRQVKAENMPLHFELGDGVFVIKTPLTVTDAKGKASVAGLIHLSGNATASRRWDLKVTNDGTPQLLNAIAKLLRCSKPPTSDRFYAQGHMKDGLQCTKPAAADVIEP